MYTKYNYMIVIERRFTSNEHFDIVICSPNEVSAFECLHDNSPDNALALKCLYDFELDERL